VRLAAATIDVEKLGRHSALYATTQLLILELHSRRPFEQVEAIVRAGLAAILVDIAQMLGPLTPSEVDDLIDRFGTTTAPQRRDLTILCRCNKLTSVKAPGRGLRSPRLERTPS
jgi:hypothetical protein